MKLEDIKIVRNAPVPRLSVRRSEWLELLDTMKHGDSVVLDKKLARRFTSSVNSARRKNSKYQKHHAITRGLSNGKTQIWLKIGDQELTGIDDNVPIKKPVAAKKAPAKSATKKAA